MSLRSAFRLLPALALAAAAAVGLAAPAQAHPIGTTGVFVTVHSEAVEVEVQIPLDRMVEAAGLDQADDSLVTTQADTLTTLLRDGVVITDADGTLPVSVGDLEVQEVNDAPTVVTVLTATPSDGVVEGDVTLDYRLARAVPGHNIYVALVSDFADGQLVEGEPQIIAVLTSEQTVVTLPREGASWTSGMAASIALGMQHIAEGTDHLLFLITLILVAPLVAGPAARGWAWTGTRTPRQAVLRALFTVLAFTGGHTITLALVSLELVSFPTTPVELLVAGSILLAAIHAMRPLIPRGEIIMAGVFGLVHGTAFASTLIDLNLTIGTTLWAVLGFNIGVELAQLIVVVLLLPPLLLVSRTSGYRPMRWVLAVAAAIASIGWIVGILNGTDSAFTPVFDFISTYPWACYAGLVAVAVILRVLARPTAEATEPEVIEPVEREEAVV